MVSTAPCWVGIDVAKTRLEVFLSQGEPWLEVSYDPPGIAQLRSWRQQSAVKLIVLEATGGLERELVADLLAAQLPVAVVNPRQVRRVAQALELPGQD